MDKHANKVMQFVVALQDCYKGEEEKESYAFSKLELSNDELTDDFIAMLEAQKFLYERITGDDEQDLIGFTHILNRLAFQFVLERQLEKRGVEADE